jgi:hypothetical protein
MYIKWMDGLLMDRRPVYHRGATASAADCGTAQQSAFQDG